MMTRAASYIALAATVFFAPLGRTRSNSPGVDPARLVVHEWGTFTTVAGPDGKAIDWLPLGGPTDLPCFVEHFHNRRDIKIALNQPAPPDYTTARTNLWGKVRMETPVLYFYAGRTTTVDVRVRFPQGLMTEWYPPATVTQALGDRRSLGTARLESVIAWPNVTVSPGTVPRFPVGRGESHYYAARNTDAAPLNVNGQRERFLFYRGVASFDVPLSAMPLLDGAIHLRNLGREAIPGVVLFENRRGVIGYRVFGTLRREATLAAPPLTGTVTSLQLELERMLVNAGLYPKEAAAMVASWRDSWFEEGTRVFYIVPSRAVEVILPLTVAPRPDSVARVFVGRMEVVTPNVVRRVEKAITANDSATLIRYGRFLEPIADRILAQSSDSTVRRRVGFATRAAFASYLRRASNCG
jgi:hypothetical protein